MSRNGVITNFTCVLDSNCPIEVEEESSCDNFGGNAVVTCLTRKDYKCFTLLELHVTRFQVSFDGKVFCILDKVHLLDKIYESVLIS